MDTERTSGWYLLFILGSGLIILLCVIVWICWYTATSSYKTYPLNHFAEISKPGQIAIFSYPKFRLTENGEWVATQSRLLVTAHDERFAETKSGVYYFRCNKDGAIQLKHQGFSILYKLEDVALLHPDGSEKSLAFEDGVQSLPNIIESVAYWMDYFPMINSALIHGQDYFRHAVVITEKMRAAMEKASLIKGFNENTVLAVKFSIYKVTDDGLVTLDRDRTIDWDKNYELRGPLQVMKEGRVKHRFYFHYGYMKNKEYDWDFSGITGFQAQAELKSDENQNHWLIVTVPLSKLIEDAPGPLMFEMAVHFEEGDMPYSGLRELTQSDRVEEAAFTLGAKQQISEELKVYFPKPGTAQTVELLTGFQLTGIEDLLPADSKVLESRLLLTLFGDGLIQHTRFWFPFEAVYEFLPSPKSEFVMHNKAGLQGELLLAHDSGEDNPVVPVQEKNKDFEEYVFDGPEISLQVTPESLIFGGGENITDGQSNKIYLAPISTERFGNVVQTGGDCWRFHSTTSYAMDANNRPRLILNCTGSVEIPLSAKN